MGAKWIWRALEVRKKKKRNIAPSQNEAEESDETEDETAGERTTRVGRTRGGMRVHF